MVVTCLYIFFGAQNITYLVGAFVSTHALLFVCHTEREREKLFGVVILSI